MENMANHNSADRKSLFLKISCFNKEYDNIGVTKYHFRQIENQRIIRKKFIDFLYAFLLSLYQTETENKFIEELDINTDGLFHFS
jgi:hypothetical protein